MSHSADGNKTSIMAYTKKYPNSVVLDVGGRIHFVDTTTGMICSVDDVTAGLIKGVPAGQEIPKEKSE